MLWVPITTVQGLHCARATAPLRFSFPCHGRQWDEATIGHLGVVVVFESGHADRRGSYQPYRDFRERSRSPCPGLR